MGSKFAGSGEVAWLTDPLAWRDGPPSEGFCTWVAPYLFYFGPVNQSILNGSVPSGIYYIVLPLNSISLRVSVREASRLSWRTINVVLTD